MKQIRISLALVGILALAACSLDTDFAPESPIKNTHLSLNCYQETPAGFSRAALSDNFVLWQPNDVIRAYTEGYSGDLQSVNTANVQSTYFSGDVYADPDVVGTSDKVWAAYPASAVRAFSNGEFCLSQSDTIKAVAGSFDPSAFICIASSATDALQFYNVLGGICFTVLGSEINCVTLTGNSDEPLCGDFEATLSNLPEITSVSNPKTAITLIADEGEYLVPGEWYFIPILPANFKKGFTLEFKNGDVLIATTVLDKEVKIARSMFGRIPIADSEDATVAPILFQDPLIKAACLSLYDTNKDGKLTEAEAAAVTSLDGLFAEYKGFTAFDEISYFTGVTNVGTAFAGCDKLGSIVLPANIVRIDDNAFNGCTSLKDIRFEGNVTSIGSRAFKGCAVKSLTVPASVTYLGAECFPSVKYLVLLQNSLPEIESSTITDEMRIGVNDKLVASCATNRAWKDHALRIFPNSVFEPVDPYYTDIGNLRTLHFFGYTYEMRRIPSGSYTNVNSKVVSLSSGYYIGTTEMTREVWIAVMSNDPTNFKPSQPIAMTCPVTRISWNMATEFNERASAMIGLDLRLPTEAEWEYAARGGDHPQKYSGSDTLDEVAWYVDNSKISLETNGKNICRQPHPVGTKQPNAFGLYDMSGNVFEWVNDYFKSEIPSGTNPVGPATESHDWRVMKGGSYMKTESWCTVYFRTYNPGTYEGSEISFRPAI